MLTYPRYKDVFSQSYNEIPGLDLKVAVHHLVVKRVTRPIKKTRWRFRPELVPIIETEVNKIFEVGFICDVKYHT